MCSKEEEQKFQNVIRQYMKEQKKKAEKMWRERKEAMPPIPPLEDPEVRMDQCQSPEEEVLCVKVHGKHVELSIQIR